MEIKFKKFHPDAKAPVFGGPLEAGADLTAVSVEYDKENHVYTYRTGIGVAIPAGYVGLIFPRSSVFKKELRLSNCVGVIDSSYRGEIQFKFDVRGWGYLISQVWHNLYNLMWTMPTKKMYLPPNRIGQLVIVKYEQIDYKEAQELPETYRGEKGFGEMTGA